MKSPRIYSKVIHEDDIIKSDTSMCNRLLHWEICHFINAINNYTFDIVLDKTKNLDFFYYLDLPNTLYLETVDYHDSINLEPVIRNQNINEITLNHSNDYHIGHGDLYILDKFNRKKYDTLRSLRESDLNLDIKTKIKEVKYASIHIRRGRGISMESYDILDISPSEKKLFQKYKKDIDTDIKNNRLHTISDDSIKYIINYLISNKKSEKIYLAYDIPRKFVHNLLNYNNKIFDKFYIKSNYDFHYYNLIDLFMLSNSSAILGSAKSTFTQMASYIGNVDIIDTTPEYLSQIDNIL